MASDGQQVKGLCEMQKMMRKMNDTLVNLTQKVQLHDEELKKLRGRDRSEEQSQSQRRQESSTGFGVPLDRGIAGSYRDVDVDPMLEEFQRFNPNSLSGEVKSKLERRVMVGPFSQLRPSGGVGKKSSQRGSRRIWRSVGISGLGSSGREVGSELPIAVPSSGSIVVYPPCSECGIRHGKRICPVCFTCGRPGHFARDCPHRPSDSQPSPSDFVARSSMSERVLSPDSKK